MYPPPRPCRAGSIVFMPRTEHRSSETNSTIARTTYYIAKKFYKPRWRQPVYVAYCLQIKNSRLGEIDFADECIFYSDPFSISHICNTEYKLRTLQDVTATKHSNDDFRNSIPLRCLHSSMHRVLSCHRGPDYAARGP